jgi:hypothetical protein
MLLFLTGSNPMKLSNSSSSSISRLRGRTGHAAALVVEGVALETEVEVKDVFRVDLVAGVRVLFGGRGLRVLLGGLLVGASMGFGVGSGFGVALGLGFGLVFGLAFGFVFLFSNFSIDEGYSPNDFTTIFMLMARNMDGASRRLWQVYLCHCLGRFCQQPFSEKAASDQSRGWMCPGAFFVAAPPVVQYRYIAH